MAIIAGVDYSMRSPGLVIIDTKKPLVFENVQFFFLTDKTALAKSFGNVHGFEYPEWKCPQERYYKVGSIFSDIMKKFSVSHVMMEDYSFGSVGKTFQIAENASVLKLLMWQQGINIQSLAPSSVKKKATGNGRADKPEMIAAFYQKLNCSRSFNQILGLKSEKVDAKPIDDIVDAYWLAHILLESNSWKVE